jgi:hypothetical protein
VGGKRELFTITVVFPLLLEVVLELFFVLFVLFVDDELLVALEELEVVLLELLVVVVEIKGIAKAKTFP